MSVNCPRREKSAGGFLYSGYLYSDALREFTVDPLVAQAGHDLSKRSTAASSREGHDIRQLVEGCAILGDLYFFSKEAELHGEYIAWLNKMGMRISAGNLESQSNNLQRIFALPGDLAKAVREKFLGE